MSVSRRFAVASLTTILLLTCFSNAFAWGDKGHAVVAHVASKLLTKDARRQIDDLLHEGESLVLIATWADGLRGTYNNPGIRPETPLWHFVDIPLNKNYDPVRDCSETPNGSCAILALVAFQEVLAKNRNGYYANSRYEALKFIVHFVGDIHQPLHCIDDNDFGGNLKKVVWLDDNIWKLHGIWDDAILSENMKRKNIADEILYAESLFKELTIAQKNEANPGSSASPRVIARNVIEGWAIDAHNIANGAYADIGNKDASNLYHLSESYYSNHKKEVDDQLKLAGIRLARILNENLR